MANAVYISVAITTAPAKRTAYARVSELMSHLAAGTGGYGAIDYVASDFGISNAQKVTITLTGPLPDLNSDGVQVTRYGLTRIA